MRYDPSKHIPGDYGYRCKACGNIAFAFVHGQPLPGEDEFMENVDVAQRGQYATMRRSEHICQHCSVPISSTGGYVDVERIVSLSTYKKALQKRLNSQSGRSRRGIARQTVDYAFMGVEWTDEEREEILAPTKAVAPPLPLTPAQKGAETRKKNQVAADQAEKERVAAEHASGPAPAKDGVGDALGN